MSDARKSNAKDSQPAAQPAVGQPLHGIEKAAWWSVPAVGAIALLCAATISVLFLNKPATVTSNPEPSNLVEAEQTKSPKVESARVESQMMMASLAPDPKSVAETVSEPAPVAETKTAAKTKPAAVTKTAAKVVTPVSIAANITMSLTCTEDRILFEGDQNLAFVDKQPELEVTRDGDVKFACLVFDGVDTSAELSKIARDQGSLEIVTLMPNNRKTCVILDSSKQRLTLRKNRDGLRWRLGGKKKSETIRLIENPINFRQWHHVMITWKNGEDAIIYVDGVEQDRYPYVQEQPHVGNFHKVVLGRTRAPAGRFYTSRVNKLVVYDQPIASEKVALLNQAVRQTYPFIFK